MSNSSILALALNILFGLVALACAVLAMTSVFMFDDPAAASNKILWFTVAAFPGTLVIYIISLALSLVARARGNPKWALLWAAVPFVGLAWIMAGFGLLEIVCGGNFGCRG